MLAFAKTNIASTITIMCTFILQLEIHKNNISNWFDIHGNEKWNNIMKYNIIVYICAGLLCCPCLVLFSSLHVLCSGVLWWVADFNCMMLLYCLYIFQIVHCSSDAGRLIGDESQERTPVVVTSRDHPWTKDSPSISIWPQSYLHATAWGVCIKVSFPSVDFQTR